MTNCVPRQSEVKPNAPQAPREETTGKGKPMGRPTRGRNLYLALAPSTARRSVDSASCAAESKVFPLVFPLGPMQQSCPSVIFHNSRTLRPRRRGMGSYPVHSSDQKIKGWVLWMR